MMKRGVFILLVAGLTVGMFNFVAPPAAHALSGGQFEPNRIVDDNMFFNANSMSLSDIQSFLNAKVPTCDTNGTQSSSHYDSSRNKYYTRAEWGNINGYPAPFTCLKNYHQDTTNKGAETNLCSGYNGSANQSAAEIIYNVAQACGVSPQVLIILLQKEQSLITDDWPWPVQYDKATGYGCPDTAPCNPVYAGFFNQVYMAARQYKNYRANPQSFAYAVGRNSYIQYNPNAGCSGTQVFLYSSATAGLYNYTPYQPNQAALSNLYGTGDGCSAYGNRNFWRMYNDWFGATTSDSQAHSINFVRLNHSSNHAEVVTFSSISSYTYQSKYSLSSYPAVPIDGAVIPLFKPNGDLSFIRLNHSSGHVEIVTYSAISGFKDMVGYNLSGYPAVAPDGAVVPLFRPNGDLSFIRLNHASKHVEVVTYSASSGFKDLIEYSLAGYPAIPVDGAVFPLFKPNGDLSFIRLNHSSGHTEIVTYSRRSSFADLEQYSLTGYPSIPIDGAVIPEFLPNGDLSFIRLNHYSGHAEVVTFSAYGDFTRLYDYELTGYPAVTPDGSVHPGFTR